MTQTVTQAGALALFDCGRSGCGSQGGGGGSVGSRQTEREFLFAGGVIGSYMESCKQGLHGFMQEAAEVARLGMGLIEEAP
jgi:hypothetical protein